MRHVILDGRKMLDIDRVHPYLKSKLKLQEYYGNNLDALWDVLSTYNHNMQIELLYHEQLLVNLGDYGEAIVQLFKEASEENHNIQLIIH